MQSTTFSIGFFLVGGIGCGAPGLPAGAACDNHPQCSSLVCRDGICSNACRRTVDCANGQTCAAQFDTQSPLDHVPSVCVPMRMGVGPYQACATDTECASGNCALGRCVTLCDGTGDCQSGQICATLFQPSSSQTQRGYRACLPETDRWQFTVPGDAIALPNNAAAVTLFYQSKPDDPTTTVGFSRFASPRGKVLYQTPVTENDFFSLPLRYVPTDSTSTLLFPNAPSLLVEPGAYAFTLLAPPAGSIQTKLQAWLTLGKAPLAQGWTRLRFHIAPLAASCLPVNAASAPAMLAGYVNEIRTIFAQAAIEIRDIEWRDVTGASIVHLGGSNATNPFVELGDRLASATSATDPLGLDVVIIDKFTDLQGNPSSALGLAGAIPSSPTGGTPHSGMAVAIASACDENLFGKVVAHELAHSLGLYHNEERSGSKDALSDTHTMSSANLMYWLQTSGSFLSMQQGQVMRNDPKIFAP